MNAREKAVELGRKVRNCERHSGEWCSCKVSEYVDSLLAEPGLISELVRETHSGRTHGIPATYAAGCRCAPCRESWRKYARQRRPAPRYLTREKQGK